jgi:hypothetical protein
MPEGDHDIALECATEGGDPMEINAAYQLITAAFAGSAVAPYRMGLKRDSGEEFIEVSFATPEVGQRMQGTLRDLSLRIGRPLRVNPNPNQAMLSARVRELLQPHGGVQREPSLHVARKTVLVRPAEPLDPTVQEELRAAYAEFCDYEMVFE